MNKNRPVNLKITTIRFPLAAIVSILHRISGVALFVGIAFALYLMQLSLASEAGFNQARDILSDPLVRFITWLMLSALFYHLIAGVRHLLLDFGIGESKPGAKVGASLTIILAALAIIGAGVLVGVLPW